ncbi:MAG: CCA tRNA nucleotidyltransferase [Candidatus Promineifilaceae bacterium]
MNLADLVTARFSAEQQHALHLIADFSAETDTLTYLVGGIVRDLLLNQPLHDIDMATVGNAITFATQIQTRHGGTLLTHAQFKTATWTLNETLAPIDLISARSETYARPATLPTVSVGTMHDDLSRRDFTINTLAMRLDGHAFGELVDLFDGSADLQAKLIRILHAQSFIDDPTRLFRAVRYEQRLGFSLAPATLTQFIKAVDGVHLLTPARVRHELQHIFTESKRFAMLARLSELGVLAAIHPMLRWQPEWAHSLASLADTPFANQFEPQLLLWLSWLELDAQQAILARLGVRRKAITSAEAVDNIQTALASLPQNTTPSTIERTLRPFAKLSLARQLAGIRQAGSHIGRWLARYESEWQHVRPAHTGAHLRALGLPPGPRFRDILGALRAARLDGQVQTFEGEQKLLAGILKRGV